MCSGTYAENLSVVSAVNVHGGFSCSSWSYAASNKVEIVAQTDAPALTLKGMTSPVFVSDVQLVAKSNAGKGRSSVAVFVASSVKVNFNRVKIEAKAGGDAEDGKNGSFTYPAGSVLNGGAAGFDRSGLGGTTGTCPGGGTSTGGVGHRLETPGTDGTPSPLGGALGSLVSNSCNGMGPTGPVGADGVPARDADPGAGAQVLGSLTAEEWAGKSGDNGSNGTPGGGGGGGGGLLMSGGAGGGGGAGGCGGAGGAGGGPGGSSIALMVFESDVALVACALVAAEAKPGGAGGAGQTGQPGGAAGNRFNNACNGGSGAKGGNGGRGGGGAGGVSAGIVWSGANAPTGSDISITRSLAPAAGGGTGAQKGADGMSADVIKI